MGDTGDAFKAFNEIKAEERNKKEPNSIKYALKKLNEIGVDCREENDVIVIEIGCGRIDFWAYTGWFCGRKPLLGKVKGRGIHNLIKEIKKCAATSAEQT